MTAWGRRSAALEAWRLSTAPLPGETLAGYAKRSDHRAAICAFVVAENDVIADVTRAQQDSNLQHPA